jgi:hypothetical protein
MGVTHAQNFRLKALALAAGRSPQDDTATRSSQLPLSLLLRAFTDSFVLANATSISVQAHCPNIESAIIQSALGPTLTTLSVNGRNLYAVAVKICGECFSMIWAYTFRSVTL